MRPITTVVRVHQLYGGGKQADLFFHNGGPAHRPIGLLWGSWDLNA